MIKYKAPAQRPGIMAGTVAPPTDDIACNRRAGQ